MVNLNTEEKKELSEKIKSLEIDKLKELLKEKYLNKNLPPRMLGEIFIKYANPTNGYSKKIYIKELTEFHPNFKSSNGCQWARTNSSWLGKQYNIKRWQNEDGAKGVSSVKLDGDNKAKIEKYRNISQKVKDAFKDKKCAILDVTSNNEIDHKNGKYTDWENQDSKTQKIEDFQSLSKSANDAKRQHCKKCKDTGKRYDAKILGYSESFLYGDFDSDNCSGCYWYDIQEFNKTISEKYKKPDKD